MPRDDGVPPRDAAGCSLPGMTVDEVIGLVGTPPVRNRRSG